MPFHIDYRPKDFNEVIGNKSTIRSLESLLSGDKPLHAYLFHGSSGCGKTTLARIIAKKLDCYDIIEINAGNNRGIDTAREIIEHVNYFPLRGETKVILLDECFAKGTKVKTIDGDRPIQEISIGDILYNINGVSKVKDRFCNKIPLHKIINLYFDNGSQITCTEDHLFLTKKGWKKAKDLTRKDLFLEFDYGLQGGYRKFKIKSGYRGRWERSQIEKESFKRQEERLQITPVRVEDIEIYKQGDNDQSFKCIIGDKERNQGFVEFYDLEVEGHPSYFVNDILVHNCHQLTKDFSNAILKVLEDCPKHVYFILCTTEPHKIIPTIRNRCVMFEVNLLTDEQIRVLLCRTAKEENVSIEKHTLKKIVERADGCPRQALILLEQIIGLKPKQQIKAIKLFKSQDEQVIDLCRGLLTKQSWTKTTKILQSLYTNGEDTERIRQAILGYMNSVMLGEPKGSPRAAIVVEEFSEPIYNKAVLTTACFKCTFEGEGY